MTKITEAGYCTWCGRLMVKNGQPKVVSYDEVTGVPLIVQEYKCSRPWWDISSIHSIQTKTVSGGYQMTDNPSETIISLTEFYEGKNGIVNLETVPFHMRGDFATRNKNLAQGKILCEHCYGTGNEFESMYRRCPKCTGEPGVANTSPDNHQA